MATKGFKGQGAYSTDRGDADCFKRDTYAAARKILRETHDRHGASLPRLVTQRERFINK